MKKVTLGKTPNPLFMKNLYKNEPANYLQEMMDVHMRKFMVDFETHLKKYLIENLEKLGHTFQSDKEFIDFITARVHRIAFEERPHYYELYLDFVDSENKGIFIGCYSDKITTDHNEGFMNLKIGEE